MPLGADRQTKLVRGGIKELITATSDRVDSLMRSENEWDGLAMCRHMVPCQKFEAKPQVMSLFDAERRHTARTGQGKDTAFLRANRLQMSVRIVATP